MKHQERGIMGYPDQYAGRRAKLGGGGRGGGLLGLRSKKRGCKASEKRAKVKKPRTDKTMRRTTSGSTPISGPLCLGRNPKEKGAIEGVTTSTMWRSRKSGPGLQGKVVKPKRQKAPIETT